MRISYRSPLLALVLLLATSCDDPAPRIQLPTHSLPKASSAYRRAPCWFTAPYSPAVECGFVTVPLSPGSLATIEIAVARFVAPLREVAADPLVVLTGGPGQDGATITAKLWSSISTLAGARDIVAIDQRGTGASIPSLDCPELETSTTEAQHLEGITACHQRLVDAGVDLSAFRTAPNADDVEAVRVALGYPAWNLFGISYGSRLALTVIRDHRAGVRSAVLSSVVPLDVDLLGEIPVNGQRAFERIFDACAAQSGCAAWYPTLEADFRATVSALDATPAMLDVAGTSVPLDGSSFAHLNFRLLYDASSLRYVPGLLAQAAKGDFTAYEKIMESLGVSGALSYGMHLSAQCAEELPFADLAGAGASADPFYRTSLGAESYVTECAIWDVPAGAALENQAVSSDVPILTISGGFDPITPPSYAARAASSFSHATTLVFEGASHSTGFQDACSRVVVPAFLQRLSLTASETTCVASSTVPTFL